MNEDGRIETDDVLLSGFLSAEETKEIILKNYRVTIVLIICSCVLLLMSIMTEVTYFTSKEFSRHSDFKSIIYYRVYPVVHIVTGLITVAVYIVLRLSYKKFIIGIEENSLDKFNQGFRNFYKMNLPAIVLFVIQFIQFAFYFAA